LDRNGAASCFDAVTADGRSGRWTHNWVEVSTPGGTLVIDPYPTGGSQIVDASRIGSYPNPRRVGIGNSIPSWSPRNLGTRKPTSNPATCPVCPHG
jgi:hypothetical protein